MNDSDDRHSAVVHLIRIEAGAYSTRLLSGGARRGVRSRVLGVLRWQRLLDEVLKPRCSRPLHKLDDEVKVILRLGLFEACVLGVPRAVATDAAVRLTRRLGKKSAAGMVNAVLRRAPADWQRTCAEAPPDLANSHPDWLYSRWRDRFGPEAADRAMESNQKPAPLCVWFRDEASLEEARSRFKIEAHPWCPGAWSAPENAEALIKLVKDHCAYAQDASSQAVAHIAAKLAPRHPRIIDLCAAPGGKTALLSRLAEPEVLVAADLRPSRANLVAGLARTLGEFPVMIADATRPAVQPGVWDIVLLDAPCSGTGTLRRHPELRWRLDTNKIAELSTLQRNLLNAAGTLVAQGGTLVYSTCSVEAEENEDLIAEMDGDWEAVDIGVSLPRAGWRPTAAGGMRILPSDSCDGFTIHALRVRSITN